MAKLTLAAIVTFINDVAAQLTYTQNNDLIELALENTLSRDGSSPNAMSANLDLNSNKLVNSAEPTAAADVATKNYVDTIATVSGLKGDTGATGPAGPMDGPSIAVDGQLVLFDGTTGKLVKEGVLTAFGKTLIDDAAAINARATLGLVIGTDVLPEIALVSQAVAEAGTDTAEKTWSALRVKQAAGANSGLTSVQVFTSSGTWTKPTGITKVVVEVVGGGGGGGGTDADNQVGTGGAGAGYAKELVDVTGTASETVTVGAAGAAGAASGPGGNGGTTSFGALLSATGGLGGGAGAAAGPAGGAGSGGDFNLTGMRGGNGGVNADSDRDGEGGNAASGFGMGGISALIGAEGAAGINYGGGGSGGHRGTTTNKAGGAGAAGIIVVLEYK